MIYLLIVYKLLDLSALLGNYSSRWIFGCYLLKYAIISFITPSEITHFTMKNIALVVIDLQKGIVAMDTAPYTSRTVIDNSVRLIRAFREIHAPVFLVHVDFLWGESLHPHSDTPLSGGNHPQWWADFVPELDIQLSDITITKRQWWAFYGTELDLQLRRWNIDTIVLCGIATSIGVESTARNAYELWYNQIFPEDAMTSRSAEEHHSSINHIFPRIGQVRSTEEVLHIIKG